MRDDKTKDQVVTQDQKASLDGCARRISFVVRSCHRRHASVVDGDKIHGQRIRLSGIDAPKSSELVEVTIACNIVVVRKPRTHLTSISRAGRLAARASAGSVRSRVGLIDGEDVATWRVGNGFAFDWRRYSKRSSVH